MPAQRLAQSVARRRKYSEAERSEVAIRPDGTVEQVGSEHVHFTYRGDDVERIVTGLDRARL